MANERLKAKTDGILGVRLGTLTVKLLDLCKWNPNVRNTVNRRHQMVNFKARSLGPTFWNFILGVVGACLTVVDFLIVVTFVAEVALLVSAVARSNELKRERCTLSELSRLS